MLVLQYLPLIKILTFYFLAIFLVFVKYDPFFPLYIDMNRYFEEMNKIHISYPNLLFVAFVMSDATHSSQSSNKFFFLHFILFFFVCVYLNFLSLLLETRAIFSEIFIFYLYKRHANSVDEHHYVNSCGQMMPRILSLPQICMRSIVVYQHSIYIGTSLGFFHHGKVFCSLVLLEQGRFVKENAAPAKIFFFFVPVSLSSDIIFIRSSQTYFDSEKNLFSSLDLFSLDITICNGSAN